MSNLFQGDPKVFITKDGASVEWRGGQTVMDAGLENMALMLLLTEPGSPLNYLFDDPDQQVGNGRFLEAINAPITSTYLNDVEEAAEQALEPMERLGLASDISATVTNPEGQSFSVRILIQPPDRDPVVLLGIKNGVNWIFQATDPAYRRFV